MRNSITGAPITVSRIPITLQEVLRGLVYAALIFLGLGTLTAVWDNSLFIRMTPTEPFDWVLLSLEGLLVGLYMAVPVPGCGIKRASLGGVLGFLGFGCTLCNKLLLLLFGGNLLMAYFDPIRPLVGLLGVTIILWALWYKLRLRVRRLGAPLGSV